MRKLHSLIGAVVAVIVMSSAALAIDQKSVLVNATVDPYVVLTVTAQPMVFAFSGTAGQEITRDNAGFTIETNTALDLTFSAGDLKGGVSHLETFYEAVENDFGKTMGFFNREKDTYQPKGDLTLTNAQAAKTIVKYHVMGTARTGGISSQEAGDYSATITVTASVH